MLRRLPKRVARTVAVIRLQQLFLKGHKSGVAKLQFSCNVARKLGSLVAHIVKKKVV